MAAFLNQDIETLDLEEVSRICMLQSEATIAGSSTVTEDEGFMRWTVILGTTSSAYPVIREAGIHLVSRKSSAYPSSSSSLDSNGIWSSITSETARARAASRIPAILAKFVQTHIT